MHVVLLTLKVAEYAVSCASCSVESGTPTKIALHLPWVASMLISSSPSGATMTTYRGRGGWGGDFSDEIGRKYGRFCCPPRLIYLAYNNASDSRFPTR